MSEVATILIMTTLAGLCIPLGGWIASFESIRSEWLENELRHFVIAFGGGLLLGAVFQMLLPKGNSMINNIVGTVFAFILGGVFFFGLERYLGLRRRESPELTGMLVDFIPETIALGGLASSQPKVAMGMAIVMGLQNIPEGFNTFREQRETSDMKPGRILRFMLLLVPLGPISGLTAHFFLSDHPVLLGSIL
ncbi:MAG TPA: hypothetical protein VFV28_06325, partial [Limnobacter sp.]|nr:hypothetical protein [Limnobacter sp.]